MNYAGQLTFGYDFGELDGCPQGDATTERVAKEFGPLAAEKLHQRRDVLRHQLVAQRAINVRGAPSSNVQSATNDRPPLIAASDLGNSLGQSLIEIVVNVRMIGQAEQTMSVLCGPEIVLQKQAIVH